ncbi:MULTISPECIES: alpha/beta hydrolase [unclassified Duganella]|uniref:alpha/beta hydrolase n=1 Tax=unclassified Duganella TaxID=2636909 RepID=UPI000E34B2E7|nr:MULTISPECIES: alpha/beta hydrolase [unclassified Duganella]RFP10005.1 alpha/beta hydrolase [Duganella sp. BJB475]RFP25690.1 alpha/beta hydrolase [Duganella sp. BJB476]
MFKPMGRTLLAAAIAGNVGGAGAAPMTLQDYLALSGPAPTLHVAYGAAPSQFAELFQPAGDGPFPVAVIVHGGCWTKEFGGITQMHNMAGDLQRQGIAVWNIEYRRFDEAGGGYPGMYHDVATAVDHLRALAPQRRLDLSRIVLVGHSAGGHLAQWAASRARLPRSSPLYVADPLPVPTVISLGGLADLRNEQQLIKTSCERDMVQLAGAASATRPDIFSDTSPAELLPSGVRTVLIHGEFDTVSPLRAGHDYARRAQAAGDHAEVIVLPGGSHYDEVAATSPSWTIVSAQIRKALGR